MNGAAAVPQVAVLLALAGAVLAAPGRGWVRCRLATLRVAGTGGAGGGQLPAGGVWADRLGAVLPALAGVGVGLLTAVLVGGALGVGVGAMAGGAAAAGARRLASRADRPQPADPVQVAGVWDLLAAGLRCGLPVSTATAVVAGQLPGGAGALLRRVADLLALGADPTTAWRPAMADPATAALATVAIRTARSGAAMADAVSELAQAQRAAAVDRAEARAQRAGVLITGPLGLCFLPAFFCLGVLPVVIGLAGQLLDHW